jgi:hypothetical protein
MPPLRPRTPSTRAALVSLCLLAAAPGLAVAGSRPAAGASQAPVSLGGPAPRTKAAVGGGGVGGAAPRQAGAIGQLPSAGARPGVFGPVHAPLAPSAKTPGARGPATG